MADNVFDITTWGQRKFGLCPSKRQKDRIQARVELFCKEHNISYASFLSRLRQGDGDTCQKAIDILTVQESYFFRDASLFSYLQKSYFPTLVQQKRRDGNKKIAIWSAGCASGEELYSIAIYLVQCIEDIDEWSISLVGTDINLKALNNAREGLYTSTALRATSQLIKAGYFVEKGQRYAIDASIKKLCTFQESCLLDAPPRNAPFDAIFCRNVFIYLESAAIEKALSYFYQALTPKGLMFLGPSDFIHYHQHRFTAHTELGINALHKKPSMPESTETQTPIISHTTMPPRQTYTSRLQERSLKIRETKEFLKKQNYHAALINLNSLIETQRPSALLYRYKGEALIGLGDEQTALEILNMAIKHDKTDPNSHFLIALLLMNNNKSAAKEALDRALYLKPTFPEAHYHLGLLYLSLRNKQQGLKHLEQAVTNAKKAKPTSQVMGSKSNMGTFADSIARELLYYRGQ